MAAIVAKDFHRGHYVTLRDTWLCTATIHPHSLAAFSEVLQFCVIVNCFIPLWSYSYEWIKLVRGGNRATCVQNVDCLIPPSNATYALTGSHFVRLQVQTPQPIAQRSVIWSPLNPLSNLYSTTFAPAEIPEWPETLDGIRIKCSWKQGISLEEICPRLPTTTTTSISPPPALKHSSDHQNLKKYIYLISLIHCGKCGWYLYVPDMAEK